MKNLCPFAVSHRRPQDRFADAANIRLSWRQGQGGTLAPPQVQANGVYFVFGFLTYSINFCSFIRSSIAPLT